MIGRGTKLNGIMGRVQLSPDWEVTNSVFNTVSLPYPQGLAWVPLFHSWSPFYNSEVPQFNKVGIISAAIA